MIFERTVIGLDSKTMAQPRRAKGAHEQANKQTTMAQNLEQEHYMILGLRYALCIPYPIYFRMLVDVQLSLRQDPSRLGLRHSLNQSDRKKYML